MRHRSLNPVIFPKAKGGHIYPQLCGSHVDSIGGGGDSPQLCSGPVNSIEGGRIHLNFVPVLLTP